METKTRKELVEPTKENLQKVLDNIQKYAQEKGYQIEGELKLPTNMIGITKSPEFSSKSFEKVVRRYCTNLSERVTMKRANQFLHMLFKHCYKLEKAPGVNYSEQEIKIKDSKKAWKKIQLEADALLKVYKETKGDFYKKK